MPISRKTLWIGAGLVLAVVAVLALAIFGGGGGY
jgi:preprotein translocase subunit SecE